MTGRYLKLAVCNLVLLLLHVYMGVVGNFSDAGLGAAAFGVIAICVSFIYSFIYGMVSYLYTKRLFVPQLMLLVTVCLSWLCMVLSLLVALKVTPIFIAPSVIVALLTKLVIMLIEKSKKENENSESSNQP